MATSIISSHHEFKEYKTEVNSYWGISFEHIGTPLEYPCRVTSEFNTTNGRANHSFVYWTDELKKYMARQLNMELIHFTALLHNVIGDKGEFNKAEIINYFSDLQSTQKAVNNANR